MKATIATAVCRSGPSARCSDPRNASNTPAYIAHPETPAAQVGPNDINIALSRKPSVLRIPCPMSMARRVIIDDNGMNAVMRMILDSEQGK